VLARVRRSTLRLASALVGELTLQLLQLVRIEDSVDLADLAVRSRLVIAICASKRFGLSWRGMAVSRFTTASGELARTACVSAVRSSASATATSPSFAPAPAPVSAARPTHQRNWRPLVGRAVDSNLQVAPILTLLLGLIARRAQVHLRATCSLVAHGGERTARCATGVRTAAPDWPWPVTAVPFGNTRLAGVQLRMHVVEQYRDDLLQWCSCVDL
jgi:hypothetical protein